MILVILSLSITQAILIVHLDSPAFEMSLSSIRSVATCVSLPLTFINCFFSQLCPTSTRPASWSVFFPSEVSYIMYLLLQSSSDS
jgi:hypothetical protein